MNKTNEKTERLRSHSQEIHSERFEIAETLGGAPRTNPESGKRERERRRRYRGERPVAVLFAPVLETLEDVLLDGVFLVSDVAIVFLHIARRRAVLVFRHAERRGIESGR